MTSASLVGRHVLVVEDEMLVSMLIEETLTDAGCVIVGPFDTVAQALSAIPSKTIDFAVLDVNVSGVKIYPVAELLESLSVPFLLLSGYGEDAIPPEHPHWRVCSKPFREAELLKILANDILADRT